MGSLGPALDGVVMVCILKCNCQPRPQPIQDWLGIGEEGFCGLLQMLHVFLVPCLDLLHLKDELFNLGTGIANSFRDTVEAMANSSGVWIACMTWKQAP